MQEINLKNWNERRASMSLRQWQAVLTRNMELRQTLWELKVNTEDVTTSDALFDALHLVESAVEEAQVHVRAMGGTVQPFAYEFHWSKS